jgi:hypothetical protein
MSLLGGSLPHPSVNEHLRPLHGTAL